MNILLFSSALAISGVKRTGPFVWSQAFVRMMRFKNNNVYILAYGENSALKRSKAFLNNIVYVSHKSFLEKIDPILFGSIPCMLKAARSAITLIRHNSIDVVITAGVHEAFGFIFHKCKVPIISVCHGNYPFELDLWFTGKRRYPRLIAYRILEKLAHRACSGVVFPSEWLKNTLSSRLNKVNGYVLRNMLRKNIAAHTIFAKKNLRLSENAPIVVSYNPMNAPHNKVAFQVYMRTVKEVVVKKQNVQFLLIGVNKNAVEETEKAAHGYPVHIMPQVENVFEVLALADIFLHISIMDTFSMITLEAMSMGLPIIATNAGALPELIENGKTGILCDLDSKKISEKLIYLVENKNLADILGKSAEDFVGKGSYSEENVGEAWHEFLTQQIKIFSEKKNGKYCSMS